MGASGFREKDGVVSAIEEGDLRRAEPSCPTEQGNQPGINPTLGGRAENMGTKRGKGNCRGSASEALNASIKGW